ncbi:sodium-dependent transporter [Caldisalinibacter kiritimatiensis]|uniref:Transporter n=1 Tax=Caldisalinibacter kiritimatiensis TaxID=1304284 RepID=R1AT50_9FIRM|nr:sodium-dependent transporter [Caldisalinibacter kiritimatiensis]EOD00313.1 Sodium-dependent transporter [Caldisalinibacter kiritimatiensis]
MEKRQRWSSRTIFVFAAIGSAAGLGNAWRFPYQAASNGGGAFLIPYFIALITAGIPLLILEFAIGHKFQAGAPTAMSKIKKGWEWLGWWPILISFIIVTYYSVIMAWVFDYLWYSLTTAWGNAPQDFFLNKVLHISSGPGELGGFSLPVIIGLIIAWIAIYWTIRDGTKSVGKVVKWTVPLPLAMLGILVIRGITLEGAVEGLNFYLDPDFSKLLDPKVWVAAYGQIFFSLSLAFGVMIAYASYLPKKSDITNNAIITALSNCGISFLSGFAVFSTIGYMAVQKGAPVAEVAGSGGVGLAFWVYPEAINLLPFGNALFALVFFIMLLTLGIDSAFSLVEGVVAGLSDKYSWNKKKTTKLVIGIGFIVSLLYATKGGLYWLDIVDRYINNFNVVTVALLEALLIGWGFKSKKLREYVNPISEVKLGPWFDILLKVISPLMLAIILVWNVIQEIIDAINGTMYEGYDLWAIVVGGWLVLVVLVIISVILAKTKLKEIEPEEVLNEE